MAGNRWSRVQEATGGLGEALMRIAILSDSRRERAEDLARQGRLDVMAMQWIDMDEQMLEQSILRTSEVTRQGQTTEARAIATALRNQADLGYTLAPGEGMSMEEAQAGIGAGIPQQWDLDPTTSRAYQARGAANTQAQAQAAALAGIQTTAIGERAEALGGQGYDVGGRPLGGPAMITMNGRQFPDTPEGQAAALEWRGQVGDIGGRSTMFSPDVMELMGGGRPPDEGGSTLGNWIGGLFGGGGSEVQEPTGPMGMPGPVQQPIGPVQDQIGPTGAPGTPLMEDSGLPPRGGLPSGVTQDQIDQLREMGYTEDQIREWLRSREP